MEIQAQRTQPGISRKVSRLGISACKLSTAVSENLGRYKVGQVGRFMILARRALRYMGL